MGDKKTEAVKALWDALSNIVEEPEVDLDSELRKDGVDAIEQAQEAFPELCVDNNPSRGPGKFDRDLDEVLYTLALDGPDEDLSEEGFGAYSLLLNLTRDEIEKLSEDEELELSEDELSKVDGASAILHERTDGIVKVDLFSSEDEAREKWAKIEKAYDKFMEEVEAGG